MRLNFRIAKFGWTFFLMLSRSQRLEGITSLQSDGDAVGHMVMWDLEGCSLEEAEETLRKVQQKYYLSDVYVVSDAKGSYRGWCFTKVSFKTLLHILLDTDYVDPSFFYYTVKRLKATLRISDKKNRPPQRLVAVLESYSAKVPDQMELVVYDTGLVKRGHTIMLGDRNG